MGAIHVLGMELTGINTFGHNGCAFSLGLNTSKNQHAVLDRTGYF